MLPCGNSAPLNWPRKVSYLFGKSDSNLEERVRQWALFELMSGYGYLINNIRIEHPCQIGTKRFPADIVAFRDERPYIVVECKREEIDFSDDWAQVISDANHLKAGVRRMDKRP